MDKRKLIGTIIGVTMFAALIAGATFAWLSFTANVENSTFNGKTKNFIITYNGGSAVTDMLQTKTPTTSVLTKGNLTVTASKTANSAKASDFKIKLHVNSNTLTTKSIVYAVCKDACPNEINLATVSGTGNSTTATCGSAGISCGTISGGLSNADIVLHTDTQTFNTLEAVSTTSYKIYFWLNPATMVTNDLGKKIDAYIYATATQGE